MNDEDQDSPAENDSASLPKVLQINQQLSKLPPKSLPPQQAKAQVMEHLSEAKREMLKLMRVP